MVAAATVLTGVAALENPKWMVVFVPALALLLLGTWDLFQSRHAVMRNYPLIGRLRWVFEAIRPQVQQYLVLDDLHGVPFNREQRSIVYARAKGDDDFEPFGSEVDVEIIFIKFLIFFFHGIA